MHGADPGSKVIDQGGLAAAWTAAKCLRGCDFRSLRGSGKQALALRQTSFPEAATEAAAGDVPASPPAPDRRDEPLHSLVSKAMGTVSRNPVTVAELQATNETCAAKEFTQPVLRTGMCAAMRRCDCWLLK